MNVFDAIVNRRSIRSYTGEPLTAEELDRLLTAANCAPVASAMFQTNHLTVITNKELLAEIEQAFGRYSGRQDVHPLYNAPILILVSVPLNDPPVRTPPVSREDWTNVVCSDAAIIVENMALEAVELGLGTCHIWGAVRAINAEPALRDRLGLPEGFVPVCGVIFGKSDVSYEERDLRRDRFSRNSIE